MKNTAITMISFIVLLLFTVLIYFYTTGYTYNVKKGSLTPTGMIAVKSIPDGAQVYLNDVLKTATNSTITGLNAGKYRIKVIKNGYVSWEKEVEVYEQLVTDITAVLITKSPRLEPLTSEGAKYPAISPTLTKIAYFTKDGKNPGIWVFPLGGNLQVNLFKSTPDVILEDTPNSIYSEGQGLEWSPDEKELLVKMKEDQYFVYDISNKTIEATTSAEPTKAAWQEKVIEKRNIFLSRLGLTEDITKLATDPKSVWSPDERKFLYKETKEGKIYYKVYNLEKPLPVGEKTNYVTLVTDEKAIQPKVYWYSDSFHLILVEGNIEEEKKGTIYLTRIDGTNKTEVYNNTLHSDIAFSTPAGDKIVILTSFKSDGQTDLYATGIR